MSSVLNPNLADAVERCFGWVRVINVGCELEGYYENTVDQEGKPAVRLKVVRRGESYLSDCPFCGDRRGRLSINHRFGVKDPQTGFRGSELWKCYNQECQNDPANRARLRDLLYPLFGNRPARVRTPVVRQVQPGRLAPCEFPGLLISLVDLPDDHPARRYVEADRGFDAAELSAVWHVGYAQSVPSRVRGAMAQGRLICPVHLDGVMVGYQARYVGELDWKAAGVQKYLTYFPKSMTLYGLDEAKAAPYVVLVEGVTDVWRYGPGAVSPLGKKLSADQTRLLAEALNGRPLVVVPDMDDPESFPAFCANVRAVAAASPAPILSGCFAVPPGSDPATLTRPAFRAGVAGAAARAVTVS